MTEACVVISALHGPPRRQRMVMQVPPPPEHAADCSSVPSPPPLEISPDKLQPLAGDGDGRTNAADTGCAQIQALAPMNASSIGQGGPQMSRPKSGSSPSA